MSDKLEYKVRTHICGPNTFWNSRQLTIGTISQKFNSKEAAIHAAYEFAKYDMQGAMFFLKEEMNSITLGMSKQESYSTDETSVLQTEYQTYKALRDTSIVQTFTGDDIVKNFPRILLLSRAIYTAKYNHDDIVYYVC